MIPITPLSHPMFDWWIHKETKFWKTCKVHPYDTLDTPMPPYVRLVDTERDQIWQTCKVHPYGTIDTPNATLY